MSSPTLPPRVDPATFQEKTADGPFNKKSSFSSSPPVPGKKVDLHRSHRLDGIRLDGLESRVVASRETHRNSCAAGDTSGDTNLRASFNRPIQCRRAYHSCGDESRPRGGANQCGLLVLSNQSDPASDIGPSGGNESSGVRPRHGPAKHGASGSVHLGGANRHGSTWYFVRLD